MNNCGRVDSRIDPYISLPLSGEVPRRGGGGTEAAFSTMLPGKAYGIPPYPPFRQGGLLAKAAFGMVLNNGALASRGELRSPANVAFGTVLPGMAYGMIRRFPRRADDICPYGAGVVFLPGRGGYQPPANVAGWRDAAEWYVGVLGGHSFGLRDSYRLVWLREREVGRMTLKKRLTQAYLVINIVFFIVALVLEHRSAGVWLIAMVFGSLFYEWFFGFSVRPKFLNRVLKYVFRYRSFSKDKSDSRAKRWGGIHYLVGSLFCFSFGIISVLADLL